MRPSAVVTTTGPCDSRKTGVADGQAALTGIRRPATRACSGRPAAPTRLLSPSLVRRVAVCWPAGWWPVAGWPVGGWPARCMRPAGSRRSGSARTGTGRRSRVRTTDASHTSPLESGPANLCANLAAHLAAVLDPEEPGHPYPPAKTSSVSVCGRWVGRPEICSVRRRGRSWPGWRRCTSWRRWVRTGSRSMTTIWFRRVAGVGAGSDPGGVPGGVGRDGSGGADGDDEPVR